VRVRLFTLAAGPFGCFAPGEHELPAELGRALVAAGAAVALEAVKASAPDAPAPSVEVQAARPAAERSEAMVRRGRGRRG